MPNIDRLLKEEIVRVARKEFRREAESLEQSSLRYRSEIAALKRHVATLERQVARLGKLLAKGGSAAVESPPNEDAQLRFRADGFRKHRARLGISAPAMAGLLGVSAQTIPNWESGRSRPSKAQSARIAVVRKTGRRELRAKLEAQRPTIAMASRSRRAALILAVLWGCVFASPALATDFHDFSVDPARHRVALYLRDAHGQILGDFDALNRHLAARGERLLFAMNGGIFMEDRRPLGLYVENGQRQRPLIVAKSGYGNFYMQPNGVFAITAARPVIVPTDRWSDAARAQPVLFATQSGPLLLIDGQINPLFAKHSLARLIRNGVCTTPSSQLWLSISRVPVTFRELAEHQKSLGCRQGLYMDGGISGAFSAEASLAPGRPPFGPLIGVTSINDR